MSARLLGRISILLLVAFVQVSTSAIAEERASIAQCQGHTTHQFAKEIVQVAYQRLGVSVSFVEMPCRRSLIEADAGRYDGEVARIAGTDEIYKNLIQLMAPVTNVEGVVFTVSSERNITSWEDLKGLRVGVIRGELYAEKGTKGLNPVVVGSYAELLSKIARGRLDVGVGIKRDFQIEASSSNYAGQGFRIIGKPVFSALIYHYVHNDHPDRAMALDRIFWEMWESGETQRIHQDTLKRMTSR